MKKIIIVFFVIFSILLNISFASATVFDVIGYDDYNGVYYVKSSPKEWEGYSMPNYYGSKLTLLPDILYISKDSKEFLPVCKRHWNKGFVIDSIASEITEKLGFMPIDFYYDWSFGYFIALDNLYKKRYSYDLINWINEEPIFKPNILIPNDKNVIYESDITTMGKSSYGYYITESALLKNQFYISKDGVYVKEIPKPPEVENILILKELPFGRLFDGHIEYTDNEKELIQKAKTDNKIEDAPLFKCNKLLVSHDTINSLIKNVSDNQIYVVAQGKKFKFQTYFGFNQPPINKNNLTMVPLRFLIEEIGGKVLWNDGKINVLYNDISFQTSINSQIITLKSKEIQLDSNVVLINDQAFIPIKEILQILNIDFKYDTENNIYNLNI